MHTHSRRAVNPPARVQRDPTLGPARPATAPDIVPRETYDTTRTDAGKNRWTVNGLHKIELQLQQHVSGNSGELAGQNHPAAGQKKLIRPIAIPGEVNTVSRYRPILIGCPHYRRFVRGTSECDTEGRYLRAADGSFLLQHIRCGQNGGRCTQTLCVLHRLNRRGPQAWFPYSVVAGADRDPPQQAAPTRILQGEASGLYA